MIPRVTLVTTLSECKVSTNDCMSVTSEISQLFMLYLSEKGRLCMSFSVTGKGGSES